MAGSGVRGRLCLRLNDPASVMVAVVFDVLRTPYAKLSRVRRDAQWRRETSQELRLRLRLSFVVVVFC